MPTRDFMHHAIFDFIVRCQQEEDRHALQRLGLEPELALRIGRLTAAETNLLASSAGRFIRIEFSPPELRRAYRRMLEPADIPAPGTKEADLCRSLFAFVEELYRRNDVDGLSGLGLAAPEAALISTLPASSLPPLGRFFWDFTAVRLDTRHIERAVGGAISTCGWMRQCIQLVRAGAPRELMIRHFSMSRREYAEVRRMHRNLHETGRPAQLTGELQHRVYLELVRQYRRHSDKAEPLRHPEFFLDIYENLGRRVPIRQIWALAREWLRAHLPAEGNGRAAAMEAQAVAARSPVMTPAARSSAMAAPPAAATDAGDSCGISPAMASSWERSGAEE